MIGNDIVDLKLAKTDSNWKRKGFLDKIFTKNEQNYILNSLNPEITVWNLWTRKEAAYKIWNRKSKIRLYNPKQFECLNFDKEIGYVNFGKQQFKTKTIITKAFVYTIAIEENKDFNLIQNINRQDIIKENGIPFLNYIGNLDKTISITNHGRFEKIIMI